MRKQHAKKRCLFARFGGRVASVALCVVFLVLSVVRMDFSSFFPRMVPTHLGTQMSREDFCANAAQ